MAAILESPTHTTHRENTEQARSSVGAPTPYRFTVAKYHKMIDAGVFDEGGRVELMEGAIIEMSPKSVLHAAVNEDAADFFKRLLKKRAVVRSQNPIALDDLSEPEPDVVVVKPPKTNYYARHPSPPDVLLVIEIADSSLEHDRRKKASAYAASGIPQYIILNLRRGELIEMREPSPEGYRSYRTLRADERFSLVAFPETEVAVGELPPPE